MSRGFNKLKGATIAKVDASTVNEVVLTDENGVDFVIEVEVTAQGVPIISLKEKRVTAKTLREAKKLYSKWCDEQGIHCNRFPAFGELSDEVKNNWIDKALGPDPYEPYIR